MPSNVPSKSLTNLNHASSTTPTAPTKSTFGDNLRRPSEPNATALTWACGCLIYVCSASHGPEWTKTDPLWREIKRSGLTRKYCPKHVERARRALALATEQQNPKPATQPRKSGKLRDQNAAGQPKGSRRQRGPKPANQPREPSKQQEPKLVAPRLPDVNSLDEFPSLGRKWDAGRR
ncbi:hypothetical protein MMC34_007541 [Xylographa carneopallida]|nr:hypothetical protein [Xylographa carneopallida]